MNQLQQQHLFWRAGFGPSRFQTQPSNKSRIELVEQLFQDSKAFSPIKQETSYVANFSDFKMMSAEEKKTFIKSSTENVLDISNQWLDKMANDKAQLRERMTLFWHDHFASSDKWDTLVLKQNNTLREHALGSFKDLLKAMCKDAMLLKYLDNPKNKKTHANENFARELLELFTLGEGNYSEEDIKAAAKAFTGHAFDTQGNYLFRPFLHDYDPKTFMGKTGRLDAEDIVDIILEQEQTAYHITTKIYRYFVHPEVLDLDIIQTLADEFYTSDYDISKLLKSIFTSNWFYDSKNIGVKVKSPIDLIVGLKRQFQIEFKDPKTLLIVGRILGQIPFHPPNVAGWPIGKQWVDSSTLLFRMRIADYLFLGKRFAIPDKQLEQMEQNLISDNTTESALTSFDLSVATKLLEKSKTSPTSLALSRWLLQSNTLESNLQKQQWVEQNSNNHQTTVLNILRLPEYQLC